jgi:ABC-type Zn uptake system ZnuABC Zn-binding protein ZnuA
MIGGSLAKALGTDEAQRLLLSGELDLKSKENTLPAPLGGWMASAAPLRGVKIICYHQSWKYFTDRFGMVIEGYLEPKPGIPPSPAHLLQIKNRIINAKIPIILTATYHNPKTGEKLEKETKAKALWLPNLVGGAKKVKTYPELIDHNLKKILGALPQ